MNSPDPSCVIVGGSAAGIAAAIELRQQGFSGAVTVVDSDPHVPYERPPLSKTLLASDNDGLVPIQSSDTYRELDITLLLGERAVKIDTTLRRVELRGGDVLQADRLILATGLSARHLPTPGATAPNVLTLRDAFDAQRLSQQLSGGGPLVIVGAGFIGLELAAVARTRGIDVTVVEATQYPLARSVGSRVAELLIDLHRGNGVKLLLGTTISHMNGTERAVEQVCLSDGRTLPAATVVVGVGGEAQVEFAATAGIDVDSNGISVNSYGQTNVPWIFAAGDVAVQPHPDLLVPGRVEHWDAALRHGAAIGSSIAGHTTSFTDPIYAWSDQYGTTLQTVGRGRATDEFILRRGARADQFLAFWVRDGHVGAAAGLGTPREIAIVKRLISSKVPVTGTDLVDQNHDLRSLLKAHKSTTGTKIETAALGH